MTNTVDRLRLADDYHLLPCGCEMGTVDLAWVYRPCSLLCRWYVYTLDRARALAIDTQTRVEQ